MVSVEAGDWLRKVPTEDRLTSVIRVVLAASALLIILLDPSEPDRFVALTYTTLGLYTLYSLILYWGIKQGRRVALRLSPWCHWLDVLWFTGLVALSSGSNSIFFFGLFFPILVASFRQGFRSGLAVTLVSGLAFTFVGLITPPPEAEFPWNRFLLRPTYLLLLGYMIAFWGGLEIRMKRGLALLSTITTLSNPRAGAEQILHSALQPIREFFNAETCLLVVRDSEGRATLQRSSPVSSEPSEAIDPEFGDLLLRIPESLAVFLNETPGVFKWRPAYLAVDQRSTVPSSTAIGKSETATVAAALGSGNLMSAPFGYGDKKARFYVAGSDRSFVAADLDFLLEVIQHLTPVLEHIELVDRLAFSAAQEERIRVARDIHDSVIQPYIGLQMGLTAIRDRLRRGGDATQGVEQLIQTADSAIQDLRRYVAELRSSGARGETLLDALKRFSRRFGELTGIEIELQVAGDFQISDRLAGETFQLVVEGLSNVRRHSRADRASVRLAQPDGWLVIEIANPCEEVQKPFVPRSISERAESLGGHSHVQIEPAERTIVHIEIPFER